MKPYLLRALVSIVDAAMLISAWFLVVANKESIVREGKMKSYFYSIATFGVLLFLFQDIPEIAGTFLGMLIVSLCAIYEIK